MEGGIVGSPRAAPNQIAETSLEPTLDPSLDRSEDEVALQGFCSPKKLPYRFLGLALMCLLGFGSYFCFDNPGALQDNFKTDLQMSTSKFVLLYSIYSWPNVILCFIGGFLLDSVFGVRLGTIIYMGLTLIGQLIFATGATINAFWLMMIGRFVFGIGAESLAVAQNSYAVLWFKGKELNMVFGLQLSFARVGSTVNFLVMEPIYNYVSKSYVGPECIGVVLFLAAITCVGSMICACILGLMDKRAERLLRRGEGQEPEVVSLKDVKDFKPIFWLIALICIAYYVAIFPFIALGNAQSVQNLGLAVVSILAGLIVDRGGYMMLEIFFLGWLWISLITAAAIWVSDMATSGGYLNMTPGQREKYEEIRHTPESLERKKLLSPESTSDLSVDDLLQPQSDISIRNRYLSRVGAMVPPHAKAPIHRPLR
ncbi:major facilitator superfamily domain-containing protein 1-like isoform X2 [Vespula pensylvanica]|uniref:major facilitator superfamily domain-containing protein 1-like isoform X2 n=1 Tax=Vespula pensylvanica TaxID=30213 RepID=UPI001CB9ED3F|nr:major facilitator superfamily domain-containing protein 1-like isoform X2 [Vespula pensylvanica]